MVFAHVLKNTDHNFLDGEFGGHDGVPFFCAVLYLYDMATAQPFAYNPSRLPISGTTQSGDFAVGIPVTGFTGSPQFWNGPDEDLGYIIAQPVPSGNQPNPLGIPAYLGFFRSNGFSDSAFLNLVNSISGQNFANSLLAYSWLSDNGYYTDFIPITPTPTPTNTVTPTVTQTPTPSITASQTVTPTNTNTPTPSITASQTQTPTVTQTPTTTSTNTPTPSITASQTQTPTITPSSNIATSGLIIALDAYNSSSYSGGTTVTNLQSPGTYNHSLSGATFTTLNTIKCFDVTTGSSRITVNGTGPTLPTSGYTYITWARLEGNSPANFRTLLTTNTSKITPITIPNGTNTLGYWDTAFRTSGYDLTSQVGTWVQYAIVGTNTSQTFYINGTQVGSTIAYGAGGTTHWTWGNNEGASQPWGYIANMFFYNKQLSLSEITQTYNFLAPRFVEPTPTPTTTPTKTTTPTPTTTVTRTPTNTPTNTPNLQGFNYTNFASTTGLTLLGNAAVSSNILYLTTAANNQVGNVYRTTAIRYDRNFSTQWETIIGGGTGADGYCVQWTSTNNSTGTGGGGVGLIQAVGTINAITFLTYSNNSYNWYKNNVLQSANSVSAGLWRQTMYFWGDYNHAAQTFALYWNTSNSKPVSANKTFTSFSFDTGSYYMGFGAATGGANDNQQILNWTLTFN